MKLITQYRDRENVKYVTGVKFPARRKYSHKYNYGSDMVVGGSVGYTGAPIYAAEAASRAGAGLSFAAVPECVYQIEACRASSAMVFPAASKDGRFSAAAFNDIMAKSEKTTAMLIGPGMGRGEESDNLVLELIRTFSGQIILDADGINAISGHIDILGLSARPMILTPHMGEFARIGGDLSLQPLDAALSYTRSHRCILVLKGHETVVSFPDGDAFVNTTGGPGLAKGGSGDVLSGIILALVGQGFSLKDAIPASVYIHGRSGDICEAELGEYSVIPEDIIKAIPKAILGF